MAQAKALGGRLSARPLTAIYTSPLTRATRTAELVADAITTRVPVVARAELAEIDHGEWSGLSKDDVQRRWPGLSAEWQQSPASVTMPGGENLQQVRTRALDFLAAARHEHAEGNLLVITHGTVLRLLLAHFLELEPDRLWSIETANCGLSIVDDYDVPMIMAVNDTCHLEGVRSDLHAQVR